MNPTIYRYLIAYAYFALIGAVAWKAAIIEKIITRPLGIIQDAGSEGFGLWLAVTLAIQTFGVIAYWVAWPSWTNTHGRPYSVFSLIFMGIPWGITEGLVLILVVELCRFPFNNLWLVGIASFIISGPVFNSNFHSKFWDIYVAPSHNIVSTNVYKIVACHTPFSIATTCYLVYYQSYALIIVFLLSSMTGSVWGMRFPEPWYYEEWPTPDPAGYVEVNKREKEVELV
jgi:hypothetical protein